jgi:adenylyltransferase/sulfurtransferase
VSDRYSRQTLFFPNGDADQERLRASRVALIGCGALGTVIAGLLVRAGVGFLRIVDRDFIEESNLQRQTLFDEQDVRAGLPKAVAAARKLAAVNGEVAVDPQTVDFDADNAARLLGDVDLAMDATDNFEARYLINDICVRDGRAWIYSAVVAGYGATMNILPRQTACLRCLYPDAPRPGATATCDTAGVIGPIGGAIGSIATAEALKLLLGLEDKLRAGLLWMDIWNNTHQELPLAGPTRDCPTCQLNRFDYLEAPGSQATALCGRSAVQVRPRSPREVCFDELAQRLEAVGQVSWNPHLLRLILDHYEVTLFPDARAIIKGTEDPSVARGIYARYIGS